MIGKTPRRAPPAPAEGSYATIRSTGVSWEVRFNTGGTAGFPFKDNMFQAYLQAIAYTKERAEDFELIGNPINSAAQWR